VLACAVASGLSAIASFVLLRAYRQHHFVDSLTEVRYLLAVGWLLVVVAAAASGRWVARRALRPVRTAAAASRRLARGDLTARLAEGADDEFGTLARSFNEMADALQRQVSELRQAAERERRFTFDVAHDLRTPLTTIVSAAALLEAERATLPAAAQRPTELLLRDVRRLHTLVLDLLALARLEGGHETVRAEVLDVRSALEATVPRPDGPRRVVITVEGDDLAVVADRVRFRAAVGNVVQNALVHAAGPVEVVARGEDGVVVVDVLDRGPGIPEDAVDRVFDRFYKVDPSRSQPGSGLGLAIARRNVELQGGTIAATNRVGGGACFEIRLPRHRDGADEGEGAVAGRDGELKVGG
jgi:two-component system sensor histidine kinase MtrB